MPTLRGDLQSDGSSTGRLLLAAAPASAIGGCRSCARTSSETGSSIRAVSPVSLGTWMRTNAYFFVSEIVAALYRSSIVPHCHSTHAHTATSSTRPTLMLSMSCTVHRLLDCLAHIRTFGFGTGTRSRGESRIWDSATRTSSRANIVRESPQSRSGPVVTNPKP